MRQIKEVSEQTGFYPSTISRLVTKYRKNGIEAISGNHYGGNHRNMSVEEEAKILALFRERAEKGQIVESKEIKAAYQAKVDHPISDSQIYFVLHRHGWRKVMPRSRHPKNSGLFCHTSHDLRDTSSWLPGHAENRIFRCTGSRD